MERLLFYICGSLFKLIFVVYNILDEYKNVLFNGYSNGLLGVS